MVQAKRRKVNKRSEPREKVSFSGVGMLLMGMVIGSLSTILWQGTQKADGGVGTGIRQMIETSRNADQIQPQPAVAQVEQPSPQETNYDFYTVLPEMEVVVVDQNDIEDKSTPIADDDENNNSSTLSGANGSGGEQQGEAEQSPTPTPTESVNQSSSRYMLQAGSYRSNSEAERLRANLAIMGLIASIQKVTIQGKGDFYRVRLGPFSTYDEMVVVDDRLAQEGVKSLRLKISGGQ